MNKKKQSLLCCFTKNKSQRNGTSIKVIQKQSLDKVIQFIDTQESPQIQNQLPQSCQNSDQILSKSKSVRQLKEQRFVFKETNQDAKIDSSDYQFINTNQPNQKINKVEFQKTSLDNYKLPQFSQNSSQKTESTNSKKSRNIQNSQYDVLKCENVELNTQDSPVNILKQKIYMQQYNKNDIKHKEKLLGQNKINSIHHMEHSQSLPNLNNEEFSFNEMLLDYRQRLKNLLDEIEQKEKKVSSLKKQIQKGKDTKLILMKQINSVLSIKLSHKQIQTLQSIQIIILSYTLSPLIISQSI